jgi:hypothetical protein
MKQKIQIIFIALIAMMVCLQAQNTSLLRVDYVTEDNTITYDEFSIEAGKVQILDDTVKIVFPSAPDSNRSYAFDAVRSMVFSLQTPTSEVANVQLPVTAYVDKVGTLHLHAAKLIGHVSIYSITGTLVSTFEANSTAAHIDFGKFQAGVYLLKIGNQTVKFVK